MQVLPQFNHIISYVWFISSAFQYCEESKEKSCQMILKVNMLQIKFNDSGIII